MEYRQKIERATTTVLDNGLVEAVVSTETKDRDGDIIRASGWELEHFMRHPVLLNSHNYGDVTNILGHWEKMEVKNRQLVGVAQYYTDKGNEKADYAFFLVQQGKGAYSVGFRPDMSKAKELEGGDSFFENYEFRGQELLEVSQVTVPSNPDALQRVKGLNPGLHPSIQEIIDELLDEKQHKSDGQLDDLAEQLLHKLRPEIRKTIETALEPYHDYWVLPTQKQQTNGGTSDPDETYTQRFKAALKARRDDDD